MALGLTMQLPIDDKHTYTEVYLTGTLAKGQKRQTDWRRAVNANRRLSLASETPLLDSA
jgi:hypothetical protein